MKSHYQAFLANHSYSHFITLEPSERFRYEKAEVQQRLRQIEFYLNTTYLKSSFPKWDLKDRFWFLAVAEGDPKAGTGHYHILLHAPKKGYRRSIEWFHRTLPFKFRFLWWGYCPPEKRPNSDVAYHKKPIWIEPIQNGKAVTVYCTKSLTTLMNSDDLFFAHA